MKFEDGIFGIIFERYVKRLKTRGRVRARGIKKSVRLQWKNEIYGGNLKVHEICVFVINISRVCALLGLPPGMLNVEKIKFSSSLNYF